MNLKNAAISFAVVVSAAAFGAIVWQWGWLSGGDSGNTPNETLRNLGIIIAGVIAFPIAIWRAVVADRQSRAAQEQANSANEQTDTAQQGLLHDRYQRGAQMLGDEVLAVRMGGVFVLMRLADEFPNQYHVEVMKTLCAFVRNPPQYEDPRRQTSQRPNIRPPHNWQTRLRPDVQAAMEAIGTRTPEKMIIEKTSHYSLDLRGADLRGAFLPSANLSSWREFLVSQQIVPSREPGVTDLTSAMLCAATLNGSDLSNADLSGVCLCNSRLQSAILSGAFLGSAKLHQVDFTEVDISKAKFSMYGGLGAAEGVTQSQIDSRKKGVGAPPDLRGVTDSASGGSLNV